MRLLGKIDVLKGFLVKFGPFLSKMGLLDKIDVLQGLKINIL